MGQYNSARLRHGFRELIPFGLHPLETLYTIFEESGQVTTTPRSFFRCTAKRLTTTKEVGIDEATTLANLSGEALKKIAPLVETASGQVRSIAVASEEQSTASEYINRSISDISRVSTETANAM